MKRLGSRSPQFSLLHTGLLTWRSICAGPYTVKEVS